MTVIKHEYVLNYEQLFGIEISAKKTDMVIYLIVRVNLLQWVQFTIDSLKNSVPVCVHVQQ